MYFLNSFAKVEFIGYVGANPEISSVGESKKSLCKFSVATKQKFSADEEPKTLWHRVIAWSKLAETAANALNSGDLVLVTANIAYNDWVDKHDQKRKDVQFILDSFVVLKRKDSDKESKMDSKNESKKDSKKESKKDS